MPRNNSQASKAKRRREAAARQAEWDSMTQLERDLHQQKSLSRYNAQTADRYKKKY